MALIPSPFSNTGGGRRLRRPIVSWRSRDSLLLETLVVSGNMESRLRLDAFFLDRISPTLPSARSDAVEGIGAVLPLCERGYSVSEFRVSCVRPALMPLESSGAGCR